MTSAARSVFVFALYLVVVGLGLLVAPNAFLAPLGFAPAAGSAWLRVLGVLTRVIAAYSLPPPAPISRPFSAGPYSCVAASLSCSGRSCC